MILEESRQGPLTARIEKRYIHSRYSPQKEADQFLERWISDNDSPGRLIVIEPGLGYLVDALSDRYSREDIFVVFLSSDTRKFCRNAGRLDGISHILYNRAGGDLLELSSFLEGYDLKDIGVIEWPASMQVFERVGRELRERMISLFRIKQGNMITESRFASLWFRNGISNFIRHDYSCVAGENSSPVILCASGPSLNQHLGSIRRLGNNCVIAALPSSLRVLREHDIEADIVFSTDPGYYAREHLKYIPEGALTVSPLSAAASPRSTRMMGFLQESPFESYILKRNELSRLPEMGTVAASAIDFLMRWKGKQPLYICGLDLSFEDIRMHASPHSFDPIILEKENRFHPGYSLYYGRASSMTDSIEGSQRFTKSMNTYQNWFRMQNYPSGIFRLPPETVELSIPVSESFPPFSGRKSFSIEKNPSYPSLFSRRERVTDLAGNLKKDLTHYKRSGEISSFLEAFCHALGMDGVVYDTLSSLSEKWAEL